MQAFDSADGSFRLRFLLRRPVAEAAARQPALQYDDLSDVVAAEGAEDLLRILDEYGIRWAVVTSADLPLAKLRLAAAGITAPVLVELLSRQQPLPILRRL